MGKVEKLELTSCSVRVISDKASRFYFDTLCSSNYKETEGWGFDDVELSKNVLSATFIHKVYSFYYTWNEKLQLKEKQKVSVIKEVRFLMDFDRHLLMVGGKISDMNAIKQGLRKIFWNHFVYDDLQMLPYDYLSLFFSEGLYERILEVTINDFEYKKQMVGKYTVKRISNEKIESFLSENRLRIDKIKLLLSYHDKSMEVVVKGKERISCQSTEDGNYEFMLYLKNNIH